MRNKTALIIAVIVIVIVAAAALLLTRDSKPADTVAKTPHSTSTAPTNNTNSSSSETTNNSNAVAIENFAFADKNITVKVGTVVTWTNKDSVAHTVTADTASSDAPDSGNIAGGATYSFTFNKAGTYAYHCAIHSDMKGTVTVTE